MTIVENIQEVRSNNPKALALFVKRAQIQLGELAEGSTCPFFLAGRLARESIGEDRDVAVALFRACCDVGTNRARRKTGWQV